MGLDEHTHTKVDNLAIYVMLLNQLYCKCLYPHETNTDKAVAGCE